MNLRPVSLIASLVLLVPSFALAQSASATLVAEGSTPTARSLVDGATGQVYIYEGGFFSFGTLPAAFQFLFDFAGPSGNRTGFITPLLFNKTFHEGHAVYSVIGFGRGAHVALRPGQQTIPFTIVVGSPVTKNGHTTFGFVNGILDAGGLQLNSSPGVVDFGQPPEFGPGVGGIGTNNVWGVTALGYNPDLTLGTTFGAAGSGADYSFYAENRTYSAEAFGFVNSQ